jgi:hypothetical protein
MCGGRVPVESDRVASYPNGATARHLHLYEHLSGLDLWVGKNCRYIIHRAARHASFFKRRQPCKSSLTCQLSFQDNFQCALVGTTLGVIDKSVIAILPFQIKNSTQARKHGVITRRNHQKSITGFK